MDEVLGPLRDVLSAMAQAQRSSEAALQTMIDHLDAIGEATSRPESEPERRPEIQTAIQTAIQREVEPAVQSERTPSSEPTRADERPLPVVSAQPPTTVSPVVASASARPTARPTTSPAASPTTSPAPSTQPARAASNPPPELDTDSDPRLVVRRVLAGLQRGANEIDRLGDAAALDAYLWQRAQDLGLRGLRLQEKGRALHAEDSFGFVNFEGERRVRLRKVVIPFDPDGIFGVTAQERAVYSGPRPSKGLPVDLVLVMGKQAPVWCLVVPLPYRNRWGSFLYIDAMSDGLEAILELELIARMAVLQLRAARFRPHEPAERVRTFRALTLRDRRERRERGTAGAKPKASAREEADAGVPDPLSRKRMARITSADDPARLSPPDSDRFDADGHLVHPLDGASILARMGELPPMPKVATRLIALLGDPQTEITALQEIMETDQAISVRLLQIANSSLYGTMREVSTIAEAVMRLGFTAIRSWLLATVTRAMFADGNDDVQRHLLWRQSVLAGIAAHQLAERTRRVDPDTAFMGGLLQNIGQLLLVRNHPDVFAAIDERARADEVSYFEIERTALGFDHADLSGLVLQKWGLGETLVTAVSAHHRLGTAGAEQDFAAIIALAEELALRVGSGPTEASDDDLARSPAAQHLGLDAETIESVAEVVGERALDRALFDI